MYMRMLRHSLTCGGSGSRLSRGLGGIEGKAGALQSDGLKPAPLLLGLLGCCCCLGICQALLQLAMQLCLCFSLCLGVVSCCLCSLLISFHLYVQSSDTFISLPLAKCCYFYPANCVQQDVHCHIRYSNVYAANCSGRDMRQGMYIVVMDVHAMRNVV